MAAAQDVFVAMPDGVRLAATLFLPEDGGRWPALLEALPYRKDDLTASYREEYHRFADEFGYAVCRLDIRGTGSSEGIPVDEYTAQEHEDIANVIAWLASREWSSGNVGMYGTSWSGFNSLQVAMLRPPALKAICSIFASDDRYADDVHYFGGALKQLDLVDWPTYMEASNALPPVPRIFGEGWRELWQRRLEGSTPWTLNWLEHQTYDDYWKHGSLREDYAAIEAATMLVTGWADGYTNIALRGFAGLRCPKRLLAGPWAHASTETSRPGPNVDLVPEMARWWDRWLKGVDNGVDRDPPIVLFVRRPTPPDAELRAYRGEWRFEPGWPLERGRDLTLELAGAATNRADDGPDELEVRGDVGWTAWISCAGGLPWGQPQDQRPDEAFSLVYEWEALEDDLEVLGHPRVTVRVASSAPVAYLSAKLCDVHPDGTSQLVTRGLLNLAHRDSRERPSALEPGRTYQVTLGLEVTSWVFEPGHRVRLDLAGFGLAERVGAAVCGNPHRRTRRLGPRPAVPARPLTGRASSGAPTAEAPPGREGVGARGRARGGDVADRARRAGTRDARRRALRGPERAHRRRPGDGAVVRRHGRRLDGGSRSRLRRRERDLRAALPRGAGADGLAAADRRRRGRVPRSHRSRSARGRRGAVVETVGANDPPEPAVATRPRRRHGSRR